MVGGYQILDLQGISLTTGGQGKKVVGIYDKIEGTRKPTMVENFSLDGVEKSARFVVFGVNDGNFEGGLGYSGEGNVLYITVTPEDVVSINSAY